MVQHQTLSVYIHSIFTFVHMEYDNNISCPLAYHYIICPQYGNSMMLTFPSLLFFFCYSFNFSDVESLIYVTKKSSSSSTANEPSRRSRTRSLCKKKRSPSFRQSSIQQLRQIHSKKWQSLCPDATEGKCVL